MALVTSLCLALPNPAAAQLGRAEVASGFEYRHWTAIDGLPMNQVTGWAQAPDGYIWLSTFDGLARFDGNRFTVYDAEAAPQLSTVRFNELLGFAGGSLWLEVAPGELVEFRDGTFINRSLQQPSLVPPSLRRFGAPAVDSVWVGSALGFHEIRSDSLIDVRRLQLTARINTMLMTGQGNLWLGTEDGRIFEVTERGRGLVREYEGIDDQPVVLLHEDDDGAIWVGGLSGVARIAGETTQRFPPFPMISYPKAIFPERGSDPLWVETREESWALIGGRWRPLRPDSENRITPAVGRLGPDGSRWLRGFDFVAVDGRVILRSETFFSGLDFDREGNAWVWGASGLYRLNRSFMTQPGQAAGYPENTYAMAESADGSLWVTFTRRGIGRLARIDGDQVDIYDDSSMPVVEMAVLEDRRGQVWLGYDRLLGGVCVLSGRSCRQVADFEGREVKGIFESSAGDLWFGTDDGVYRRDLQGGWQYWGAESGLPHPYVRSFVEDREGRIWMGTYGGGVAIRDEALDSWTHLGPDEGLVGEAVRSIHIDERGVAWIGYEGSGLDRVERVERSGGPGVWQVTHYSRAQGLYDPTIHQILADDQGRLWFSTNRGLFWVYRANLDALARGEAASVESFAYGLGFGLRNPELNGGFHGAGLRSQDGQLIFAGIAGLVWVDPIRAGQSDTRPPVFIETVDVGDQRTAAPGAEPLTLPVGVRALEVEYTAVAFRNATGVRFRYRLDGFDDDWVDAGLRRTAFYTNLPPGTYVFRVAAADETLQWVEAEVPLTVIVPPRFFERPVTQIAIVLAVFLGFGVIVRRRLAEGEARSAQLEQQVAERTRTAEAQAQRLRELDEEKNFFFQDLSHELRTPLALIVGSLERLRAPIEGHTDAPGDREAQRSVIDAVRQQTDRLTRLTDQLLDLTRLESGSLELRREATPIADFVQHTLNAFRPIAEPRGIKLRLDTKTSDAALIDRDAMGKALANLIANAIKFSPDESTVDVSVTRQVSDDGAHVVITVRDYGLGIPDDEVDHIFDRFRRGRSVRDLQIPGTGIGLALVRRVIDLHQGHIDVTSSEGLGSAFTVQLPACDVDAITSPIDGPVPATIEDASAAPDADVISPVAASTANDSSKPHILVVEDQPEMRALLTAILQPHYRVSEARDGQHALEQVEQLEPDLVVCDVKMPRMEAQAFVRAFRDRERSAVTPVVIVSARASAEDRAQGLSWGADDYITKPFEPSDLLARVDAALARHDRIATRARPVIHVHPSEVEVVDRKEAFLMRVRDAIERRLSDAAFGVPQLAREVGLSRSALYRQLEDVGEGSPADLIRQMRLERGRQLLESGAGSVSRIAYDVGFKSPAHFSRPFKQEFGVTPSEFTRHSDSTKETS